MIEIAISLAVIVFALVAIIGVLPTGMTVQKQNLEETIITQDGVYLMEAIRSGAEGIYDLSNYVSDVSVYGRYPALSNLSGGEIIGLLSTPNTTNVATLRAISGAASEKGTDPDVRDFAFKYRLKVEVEPFWTPTNDPLRTPQHTFEVRNYLSSNLYNLRLEFQWPVLANGEIGNRRRVFRSLVPRPMGSNSVNGLNLYFFTQR